MAIWLSVNQLNTFMIISYTSTGWRCLTLAVGVSWSSLSVAGLTHPDRTAAPASLWHGHPVAGAGMAETLAAWSTVVFPFCLCEHLLTAMTCLMRRGGSNDGRKDMLTVLVQALSEQSAQRCQTSVCFFSSKFPKWEMWISAVILVIWMVLQCLFSTSAIHTHSDLCVGSPVWWRYLISEPGSDSFSGACAVLWHWLDHVVHPIQYPLGRVLMGR